MGRVIMGGVEEGYVPVWLALAPLLIPSERPPEEVTATMAAADDDDDDDDDEPR